MGARMWPAMNVGVSVQPCVTPCHTRRVSTPSARRQPWVHHLDGLLSDTRRKNGWQLAEMVGDATPYGFQHLLGRRCSPMWQSTWGIPRGWSRSTRRAFPNRKRIRREWDGRTAGRWARWATAKWGSSWPTSGPGATRCWTGSCTCPRLGRTTRSGCRWWGWHPTHPSRPSRS